MALVLIPAFLMVSTIRFRSFKTIDLQAPRSYTVLMVIALVIAAIFAHPQGALLLLVYGYAISAFVELAIHRLRRRSPDVKMQEDRQMQEDRI
jgi:phosphatidylserine synthase